MFNLFIFILPLATAALHLRARRKTRPVTARRAVELVLVHYLVLYCGVVAAIAGLQNVLFPESAAALTGREPGSSYQQVLGFAGLGIAALGFLSFKIRGRFLIAPAVANYIFLFGAGYVHLDEIVHGTALELMPLVSVLIGDVLIPVVLMVLLITYLRMSEARPRAADAGQAPSS